MLHVKGGVLERCSHLGFFRVLQVHDSLLCFTLATLKFKNFRVGNQGLLWLFTLFVKDSKVKPNFIKFRSKSWRFYYCFKWFSEVVLLVEQDSETCPVDGIVRRLHCGLLKAVESLSKLLLDKEASCFDVEIVRVVFRFEIGLVDIVYGFVNVTLLKVAPRDMLVNAVVLFIVTQRSFIWPLGLHEVILQLEQNAYFQKSINASFHRKVTRKNTVLEVSNRLIELVCFSKNHP